MILAHLLYALFVYVLLFGVDWALTTRERRKGGRRQYTTNYMSAVEGGIIGLVILCISIPAYWLVTILAYAFY